MNATRNFSAVTDTVVGTAFIELVGKEGESLVVPQERLRGCDVLSAMVANAEISNDGRRIVRFPNVSTGAIKIVVDYLEHKRAGADLHDFRVDPSLALEVLMAAAYLVDMYSDLIVESAGSGVVRILLNRPERLNAIRVETLKQLERVFTVDLPSKREEVRVVVIGAVGEKVFSAGLDLTCPVVASIFSAPGVTSPGVRADELRTIIKAMQSPLLAIANFPHPVICAVNGLCFGLGVDIACACDIRVASRAASFSVREVKIGICADLGSLFFLPKISKSDSWVRKVSFSGSIFSADEAYTNGFVSDLVEGDAMACALKIAGEIAENATIAVAGTKENLNFSSRQNMTAAFDHVALWNSIKLQEVDVISTAIAKVFASKNSKAKL